MIVIVCGGRDFTDVELLFRFMDAQHAAAPISLVIEGGQRTYRDGQPVGGADLFAWNWAAARSVPCTTVEANWTDLSQPGARIRIGAGGRRCDANAGPRRNAAAGDGTRSGHSPPRWGRARLTWCARRAPQESEQSR